MLLSKYLCRRKSLQLLGWACSLLKVRCKRSSVTLLEKQFVSEREKDRQRLLPMMIESICTLLCLLILLLLLLSLLTTTLLKREAILRKLWSVLSVDAEAMRPMRSNKVPATTDLLKRVSLSYRRRLRFLLPSLIMAPLPLSMNDFKHSCIYRKLDIYTYACEPFSFTVSIYLELNS